MLHVACFLLGWLSLAACHSCAKHASYPRHGKSALVLFSNDEAFPYPHFDPMVQYHIQTPLSPKTYGFESAMDTGSTGLAISAKDLGLEGADLSSYDRGSEYLSSSHRLWEGYWIPSNLTFNNTEIVARIPILAVTQNSTCLKFSRGSCAEGSKVNATKWPTGINYMGMGFGRGSDEQPQALPDKVPFVNIVSINGSAVPIHSGYVLTERGVEVGLTAANTWGFKKAKLELRANSTPTDWQMAAVAISIDGSEWNRGQALFDTGVDQSYVRVGNETYQHLHTEKFQGSTILKPGSVVNVLVGDMAAPIASYKVAANDTRNPMNPYLGKYIAERPSKKGPYINTGRHFYYGFDAMLDAECGWFGLKQKDGGAAQDLTKLEL